MLKPLPSESSSEQNKNLHRMKFKKRNSNHKDYKSEQKQLLKVGNRLKVLGKFPEKFPTNQFKILLDETKNILYTIRRIELNLKLHRKKKKKFDQG